MRKDDRKNPLATRPSFGNMVPGTIEQDRWAMALSEEWWDRWWTEDWSWEGLAEKPWEGWVVLPDGTLAEDEEYEEFVETDWKKRFEPGTRLASLQDYWRRSIKDAGLTEDEFLIPVKQESWVETEDQKHFTLMHLPPEWRDGTPTEKADPRVPPERLIALLRAELGRNIKDTMFAYGRTLKGPDHHMRWQGAILPDFSLKALSPQTRDEDDRIPISITAYRAGFSGDADFMRADFSGTADFVSAGFSGTARFSRAGFFGGAHFGSANFSGYADFADASFSGYVDFKSASFSGTVLFGSARFSGYANFSDAGFSGKAHFGSASFSGYANFSDAGFSRGADFSSAGFSGYAYFESAVFLRDARFSGQGNSVEDDPVEADLELILSEGKASGTYKQPKQSGWIAQRSFPGADFGQTVFFERADFDNRDFHDRASFQGAVFLRQAAFHNSDLHRGMHFRDTDFGFALNRQFGPLRVRRPARGSPWVRFQHWVKDSLFPNRRPVVRQAQHIRSIARARRRLFQVAKQSAKLPGRQVPSWKGWKSDFANELEITEIKFLALPVDRQNAYYAEVEDCFRTLKHKMEDRRDRGQEARFFRMELLARRQRRNDPHVPWWEDNMSVLYQGASDFGASFVQPLIVLFLMVVPWFAVSYWLMMNWYVYVPDSATLVEALSFSFSRILPFGPWASPDACSVMGQMLSPLNSVELAACQQVEGFQERRFGPGTPIGVRLLASFQSLTAIVLVFLSGLAIRRRFQIN